MAQFDDGKADDALRTIGEVSEGLGIKPHVLRYWEQQFSLLKPLKRSGGRRYYRAEDIALVETIDRLVNQEGYTLRGAEAVLRSSGKPEFDRRMGDRRAAANPEAPSEPRADERRGASEAAAPQAGIPKDEMVTRLKALRARLARAIEA